MKTLMTVDHWIEYTAQSNDRVIEFFNVNDWFVTILKSPFEGDYMLVQSSDGNNNYIVSGKYYFIVSDDLYIGQLFYSLINTDLSVYDNHIIELHSTAFFKLFLEDDLFDTPLYAIEVEGLGCIWGQE